MNLAHADLPKESGSYDLSIVLGILATSGQIPTELLSRYEFAGELALTGELRPIRGALAMNSCMIRDSANVQNKSMHQKRAFILPHNSAAVAALVNEAIIYRANSLLEVYPHLSGHTALMQLESKDIVQESGNPDFCDAKAQSMTKRAYFAEAMQYRRGDRA